MNDPIHLRPTRWRTAAPLLLAGLALAAFLGLVLGSVPVGPVEIWRVLSGSRDADATLAAIIWKLRFPRVLTAAIAGAALSSGGLVFQALLRNPLAEPYILGVSGGAAVGGIVGILLGFARLPGVGLMAFAGSMLTLGVVLAVCSGWQDVRKDALLLSGVMVNAFCSAAILFLISLSSQSNIHNILFWLMGDLSSTDSRQALMLGLLVAPCLVAVFLLSHRMNLLLFGEVLARSMGVRVRVVVVVLLVITSFMVSATVCHCGLLGFVGLVVPHLLRLLLGPDHRVLVPATVVVGGAYMILCDLLCRLIPQQGEMPVGVITAMIGAPLFIVLMKGTRRL